MTDIIAETQELMRQERFEKFWKENGKTLLLFVAATIVMTGAVSAYRTWDADVKARSTDKILTLMEDKTFPDNIKDENLDVRPGLRGIALINGAQAFLAKGKNDEALGLYAKAAEDNAIPHELQDLAILMQVRLAKDAAGDGKLLKKLSSIAKNKNSPWRYHAQIEAASLAAAKQDYKTARQYLNGVRDQKTAPETLVKKAEALDHIYALREKNASAKTPKEGS